jgi:predicted nucleic acid-binding protein
MGLILDTNVFIHIERSQKPIDFSQWQNEGEAFISIITVSELLVGVHRANDESRRLKRAAFVEAVIAKLPILPFDTESARIHAQVFALLTSKGQMIGAHDLIIAATALRYDYAVLTANLSEFERVPNLNVLPLLAEKTKNLPYNSGL